MIDDVNSWETDAPLRTEKEKKEAARQRITSELEGNPNLPKKKTRKLRFKPPTKEEEERMKFLDYLGNPIKGYKWEGTKIVKIDELGVGGTPFNLILDRDYSSDIVMLESKGMQLTADDLVEDPHGGIISEDGKKTYSFKKEH